MTAPHDADTLALADDLFGGVTGPMWQAPRPCPAPVCGSLVYVTTRPGPYAGDVDATWRCAAEHDDGRACGRAVYVLLLHSDA